MSNKELEQYLDTLDKGLFEAEKKMLQEKAARHETVVNADDDGNIHYVLASDIIAQHPEYK